MSVIKSLKKSSLILIVIIVILLMSITILLISNNTKKVIISGEDVSKENITSFNALTMMYETGYQSGEYQVSSDIAWPQERYVFNETLSKCENGSKIYWDSNTNRVLIEANTADKCYVYFDFNKKTYLENNYSQASYCYADYISDDSDLAIISICNFEDLDAQEEFQTNFELAKVEKEKLNNSDSVNSYLGNIVDTEGNVVTFEEYLGYDSTEHDLWVSVFATILIHNYDKFYGNIIIKLSTDNIIYPEDEPLAIIIIPFEEENNGVFTRLTPIIYLEGIYREGIMEFEIYPELALTMQENKTLLLVVSKPLQ